MEGLEGYAPPQDPNTAWWVEATNAKLVGRSSGEELVGLAIGTPLLLLSKAGVLQAADEDWDGKWFRAVTTSRCKVRKSGREGWYNITWVMADGRTAPDAMSWDLVHCNEQRGLRLQSPGMSAAEVTAAEAAAPAEVTAALQML